MISRISRRKLAPAVLGLAVVLSCGRGREKGGIPAWLVKPPVPPGTDLEQVLRHNNLGVAHLEQHHYGEAAEEFEKVVAALPGWPEGQINLGIAALNLHENPRAEEQFRKALALSPSHPNAHYSLGLVLKQDGKTEEALAEFRKVEEVVPADPDTLYNIGLLHARNGQHAEAVKALERILTLQPANVSARFRLATSLLALGRKEEGDREMSVFREMNGSGAALSMGLFTLLRAEESGLPAAQEAAGKNADHPGAVSGPEVSLCAYGPGIAATDVEGDGDVDLFLPGCGTEGASGGMLLRNDGKGRFADATRESGLDASTPSVAAAFGDYDNDGHADLYVTGPKGNHLFRNQGAGVFAEVTAAAGVRRRS
jgi:Tfp pilus assembly protein PilF